MPSTAELKFFVCCKQDGAQVWETIAAFDIERAADWYARTCKQVHPRDEYRVTSPGIEPYRIGGGEPSDA